MNLAATLERIRPLALSLLRIVAAGLLLQHGLSKFFGFPSAGPALSGLLILAALIETIGGVLLVIGWFSRWAAFVVSGEMAFAYFLAHAPKSVYPIVNGGDAAVLYCFVFFYLFFAGPGPVSVDRVLKRE